ncbi:MAG: NADH-quinone oxidoreductase subunit M [Bacteroidota bacterium]|nr:NADH-quinone oxidoreductase subunit M [Bacteroidota bacterium]MDP4232943.1 NADH-quinone oxidoreductase subunit M [Bacteroidota bacterium]MDP4241987.1 NADH-quinone oxidoreductase subunit M [Bacteroidota bacterium]MDP4286890.1 NADH-quinone oxidoreductase subunit M [Bacteroidota bacterium]
MSEFPLLGAITFLPLVGMIALAFVPRERIMALRSVAVAVTLAQVAIAVVICLNYNTALAGVNDVHSFQFVERLPWIRLAGLGVFGNVSIDYFMGIDGLSVGLVLLTAIITTIGALASFSIDRNVKGYFLMFLLLDVGMMGTFCALDFFLFYIFWEVMLLPMYFLIGIWGGARREYAAIKFFIYTLLGSVVMLLVMIGLYFSTEVMLYMPGTHSLVMSPVTHKPELYHSFNMLQMMNPAAILKGSIFSGIGTTWRYVGFIGLLFAFAIKIPMVPFHTWLPDAHVEAPTAISVLLAGVLLKMGGYGIIRLCLGIFPDIAIALSWYLAMFGFINIVYGAFCAMAQSDFKKLIAYSSISHMGYVLLGIAALNTQGLLGASLQMVNHGIVTAMLFVLVGVLYDRTHTRGILEFGGLANKMPKYFAFVVIAFFAALGLPALNMFVSEAFVLIGSFQTWQTWTILSTFGIILTASYFLWTLQRMFFGTLPEKWNGLTDVTPRELATLIPLVVIIVALGVYPGPLVDLMTASVNQLVLVVHAHVPPSAVVGSAALLN